MCDFFWDVDHPPGHISNAACPVIIYKIKLEFIAFMPPPQLYMVYPVVLLDPQIIINLI